MILEQYEAAGASIASNYDNLIQASDIVLQIRPPTVAQGK